MRRVLIGFIAGIAAAGAVAAWLHHREARPTVATVADAAARPAQTRTLPSGLPDLGARGWTAVGGRVDEVGGRRVASGTYRRGEATVTISRMLDGDGLNDGAGSVVRSVGDLQLSWTGAAGQLRARTVLDGHQTVLAGSPASASVRRELTRVATALARR